MEVEFNDVSYKYNIGTPLEKVALKSITTKLSMGKINALIGPSGSGKTTFIEMINALLIPTSGSLQVGSFKLEQNNKINNINDLRFDVGLIFQFPEEQFFQPTVEKEIAFGMKYFKYRLNNMEKRILDALKMVGLDETYLNRNPFELSSGEMRKVAIASILSFNPKIVIFDEPTIGLDNKSRKNLIHLIRKLRDRYHKTIIIVSHDIDLLYQISDNFIILKEGNILLNGSKQDIEKNLILLRDNKINLPKVLEFTDLVRKKKSINLGNKDNINDLIKVIYRNV